MTSFKYGHSELDFEVAKSPLIIYSNKKIYIDNKLRNHYIIGKAISRDLGFNIINPNGLITKTYYINGLNIYGKVDF